MIDGNLFLNNAVGISFGNANGSTSTAGGVIGQIENNVFMGDHPIGSTAIGEGIEVGNIKANSGVTISGNIFADDNELSQPAINLIYATSTSNPSAAVGINDLTISNNIIDGWRTGILIGNFENGGKGITGLNDLNISNNQFQNIPGFLINHQNKFSSAQEHWSGNVYYSTVAKPIQVTGNNMTIAAWKTNEPTAAISQEKYAAPTRTAATYNATLGGGNSLSAFLARADAQSDNNWSTSYTAASALAYLRAGFSTTTSGGGTTTTPTLTKLVGTVIGTSGSFQNAGNTIAEAFDGNINTFFDGPVANGNWAGLDLGSARTIKQISYAPRTGWAHRLVGGVFQGSNSANFTSGVDTLYTITGIPAEGSLTTVNINVAGKYRYVRYLSPNGYYGNIAEINFLGL